MENRRNDLDIDSFRNEEPGFDRARMRRQSGGFVDLGNESQYGSGGHQASGANEIFADIQVCGGHQASGAIIVICFLQPSKTFGM